MISKTSEKRALMINFNGIGNGFMIIPVLKCIEGSKIRLFYYHIDNSVLRENYFFKKAALKNLLGFIPSRWRRFYKKDWEAIRKFIVSNKINLIINMRNEGNFDKNYYQFRKWIRGTIEFWELNFSEMRQRNKPQLLIRDILCILKKNGIETDKYNPQWLRNQFPTASTDKNKSKRVGFFTGASQSKKQWSAFNWTKLADLLLQNNKCRIKIYSGADKLDKHIAVNIARSIQKKYPKKMCRVGKNGTIRRIIKQFHNLDLLVSNDTFAIHVAAALDIPAVGLYFSTDSRIWGGDGKKFYPIQSQVGLNCRLIKPITGNCMRFYGDCTSSCKKDENLEPRRVAKYIDKIFFKNK